MLVPRHSFVAAIVMARCMCDEPLDAWVCIACRTDCPCGNETRHPYKHASRLDRCGLQRRALFTFASKVFPVPGGPYSSMPFACCSRGPRKRSGRCRGAITWLRCVGEGETNVSRVLMVETEGCRCQPKEQSDGILDLSSCQRQVDQNVHVRLLAGNSGPSGTAAQSTPPCPAFRPVSSCAMLVDLSLPGSLPSLSG